MMITRETSGHYLSAFCLLDLSKKELDQISLEYGRINIIIMMIILKDQQKKDWENEPSLSCVDPSRRS